jgi:Fe-S-cluster containining protein
VRLRRRASLPDIYARIPPVECKGLCQDSCGPIAMSAEEDRRLVERGVAIPSMVDAVAAVERGDDYYCPALVDGRCTVYEDRPTICRLWGATQSMPCPYGCTPADALTQEESHELLRQAGEAGGGMADRYFRPGH